MHHIIKNNETLWSWRYKEYNIYFKIKEIEVFNQNDLLTCQILLKNEIKMPYNCKIVKTRWFWFSKQNAYNSFV
jgi:hypothetical protein